MKKHITFACSLLMVMLLILSVSSCSRVEISECEIVAVFKYGDSDITQTLSDEDSEIVREIFNEKRLFSGSTSCGFSKDVALIIDGNTYCVACDSCSTIYISEKGKYFNLSKNENESLRNMLDKYGFTFPCV